MKRSSLRSSSRPALIIAMAIGLATCAPGVLAQSLEERQPQQVERFRTLFEQASATSRAEFSETEISREALGDGRLSEAEVEGVIQVLRDRNSETQKRAETATANDVVGSVSVVARCAEGSIASTRVQKSANDVEILSEQRVACDESGCKAVQVNARRASQEPFTLVVSVACNG